MKLLFKQRIFSWFDSYDVYDQNDNTVFTVKGELSWGHLLRIYDAAGNAIGHIQEKVLTFLPKFEMYIGNKYAGSIRKEFSFFIPKFDIDFKGWYVEGDFFEWDYRIYDSTGGIVATISKDVLNFVDVYELDISNPEGAIYVLMLVLAIDAEKCSRR